MNSTIFDHSPWLVSEDRFTRVSDEKTIDTLLRNAKERHSFLTICDNDLNLHFKSVMIRVNNRSLQIDKPIEWNQESNTFKIFFQDNDNHWSMIKTDLISEGLYVLNASKPCEIFRLKNRRNDRIKTSSDTTTSFFTRFADMSDLEVLNLSRSGMLVCGIPNEKCLPINSVIEDISITHPQKHFRDNLTRVDKGKVVRTFNFNNSQRTCHAITFINDVRSSGHPEPTFVSEKFQYQLKRYL